MDLLCRLLAGEGGGTPGPADDYWYGPIGTMTPSGVRMGAEEAKKISAWFRGRDILATVLAMLPLQLFERLPNNGGADPASRHPLYDVLHAKPNDWQDSFQWRRQAMYHLIDYGNSYQRLMAGPRGFADQLRPIHPSLVDPRQLSSGRVVYQVRDSLTNQVQTLTQDEVFHLRGASDDGVKGQGILEHARNSLGTAAATESYAARIFSSGTLNGGIIEVPGVLNDDASKRMARSFVSSMGEWHLPKVLEQGSKWVANDMTPEDAQMLLSRKHTVDDIARWLGIPRQMLENSDPSYGNAEQFNQAFIDYTLGPWLSLWESAINAQLILATGRFFAQFTRQALVRGNFKDRWQGHVEAVNAGIITVDEVRAVEDLNKRGGKADELREPQNITGKPRVSEGPTPAPTQTRPPKAMAIATESSARLLRKEIAAVQKAAVRHAADADAFAVAVTAFYDAHATLVAQSLSLDETAAREYCASQAAQLLTGEWVSALALWTTTDYAQGLAAWALEDAA